MIEQGKNNYQRVILIIAIVLFLLPGCSPIPIQETLTTVLIPTLTRIPLAAPSRHPQPQPRSQRSPIRQLLPLSRHLLSPCLCDQLRSQYASTHADPSQNPIIHMGIISRSETHSPTCKTIPKQALSRPTRLWKPFSPPIKYQAELCCGLLERLGIQVGHAICS